MHSDDEDKDLFAQQMLGIKPLKQDKVLPYFDRKHQAKKQKSDNMEFNFIDYFSDNYDPFSNEQERYELHYQKNSVDNRVITRMSKGQYEPELIVDLHGLNTETARKDLLHFFYHCHQHQYQFISIVHGHGKGILKAKLNLWLRQHPAVLAYTQAPNKFRGSAAIIVLLSLSFADFLK